MPVKLFKPLLLMLGLSLSMNTLAAEAASSSASQPTPDNGFTGSISLSLNNSTGNVKSQGFDFGLDLNREVLPWRYRVGAEAKNAKNKGTTIKESYFADFQTDYVLPDGDSYWFGYLSAEQNKFASIDRRLVEAAGYGTALMKTPKQTLTGDIGLGARQSAYTPAAVRADEREGIAYFGLGYQNQLTDNTRFNEDVTLIPGSEFTYAQSTTALEVAMSKKTSIKLSYEVKHNSKVSAGFEKTDASTKASIVFGF